MAPPVTSAIINSFCRLLLQRGRVTPEQVDEAARNQLLHGEELTTHLLHVGAIDEATLQRLLSECHQLPLGPPGELPSPPLAVTTALTPRAAHHHRVLPLDCSDGVLQLAVDRRLSSDIEKRLGAACRSSVQLVVVTQPRLEQALARYAGLALRPWLKSMLAALGSRVGTGEQADSTTTGLSSPPQAAQRAAGQDDAPVARAASVPPPPPSIGAAFERSFSSLLPTFMLATSGSSLDREQAAQQASEATDVGTLLEITGRFAKQHFASTLVFAVVAGYATLRVAHGHERSSFRVDLSEPGLLRRAWVDRQPVIGQLADCGEDQRLRDELARGECAAAVACIPIVIRDRVVVLIYGDGGQDDVERAAMQQVVDIADAISRDIARIILRKKTRA